MGCKSTVKFYSLELEMLVTQVHKHWSKLPHNVTNVYTTSEVSVGAFYYCK